MCETYRSPSDHMPSGHWVLEDEVSTDKAPVFLKLDVLLGFSRSRSCSMTFNCKELNRSINFDEAVAHGTAVQAAILTG